MQRPPSKHRKKLIPGTWFHIPEELKYHTAAKKYKTDYLHTRWRFCF